jgi:hypothetical protein
VVLPEELVFVVMNSLQREVKLEGVAFHLNKRFCECKMVAAVLGRKMGFVGKEGTKGVATTLKELERWAGLTP